MKTLTEEISIYRNVLTEASQLLWKVSSAPTGAYKSFEKRRWPVAYYKTGEPAVQLICDQDYNGRTSKAENLTIKVGIADWGTPSNKETGAGFTWRYLKQRANSLSQAKMLASTFLQNHAEFVPKEVETKKVEESIQTNNANESKKFVLSKYPSAKIQITSGKYAAKGYVDCIVTEILSSGAESSNEAWILAANKIKEKDGKDSYAEWALENARQREEEQPRGWE
jgi:hypothetical protein